MNGIGDEGKRYNRMRVLFRLINNGLRFER